MDFLKKNLSAISPKRHFIEPRTVGTLSADVSIQPAKVAGRFIQVAGKALQSSYHPEKELIRLIESKKTAAAELTVILGLSTGFTVQYLLETGKRVIVIEPHLPLFQRLMAQADYSALFIHTAFGLIAYEGAAYLRDHFPALLKSGQTSRLTLFSEDKLTAAFPDIYVPALKETAALIKYALKDRETAAEFSRAWIVNYFKNLPHIERSIPLDALVPACRSFPGVLVAAGPSLDRVDFNQLKKASNTAIVVACDSALSTLLKHGVRPHFVIAVDCQYINFKHLAYQDTHGIIGVMESGVESRTPAMFERVIFYHCGSGFCETAGDLTFLRAGGSVATIGYSFLKALGITKIILLGQDLAFDHSGKSHAGGSFHETYALARGKRFQPAGQSSIRLHAANAILTKDIRGRTVWTTDTLRKFRDWYLWELEQDRHITVYNASDAGILSGGHMTCISPNDAWPIMGSSAALDITKLSIDQRQWKKNELSLLWRKKKPLIHEALTRAVEIKTTLKKPDSKDTIRTGVAWLNTSGIFSILGRLLSPFEELVRSPYDGSAEQRQKYGRFLDFLTRILDLIEKRIDKLDVSANIKK